MGAAAQISVVNTDFIPGYRISRMIGLVRGNTVRTKHALHDIAASLKTIIGGEIGSYTEMLSEAREQATVRMIDEARQRGANAVINVRYATSAVMAQAAEILCYGTAVIIEPDI